jgi:hypothetical protein
MSVLRTKMQQDMVLRGLASSTQNQYIKSVKKLADHYKKSPDILTNDEIRNYLLDLKKRIWPQILTTLISML